MAVIEKIRQRSALVLIIIGVALISFLLSDALNNNPNFMRGEENNVGEIAGKPIDYKDYSGKLDNYVQAMEQQGQKPDEASMVMVRDQIWNEYIQELVVNTEYEKVGLKVTPKELFEAVTNPEDFQQIREAEAFKNKQTGMFDPALVVDYLKNLDSDKTGEAKKSWVKYEESYLIPTLLQKKYNSMIRNGVYRTSVEVKNDMQANYVAHDAKIAGYNFNSIQDTTIKVTEADMKAHLKKYPERYQQDGSRKIEYVLFELLPSKEDSANIKKDIMSLLSKFEKTTDDTAFVQNSSDDLYFDTSYKSRGSYPQEIESALFNAEAGTVHGPVFKDGKYRIYKVLGTKTDTVSYIKASQILLKPTGFTKEDSLLVIARANNVLRAIQGGASWAAVAKDSSGDYPTSSKGGDLGWIRKGSGRLPEAVESTIFRTAVGGYSIVRSNMGVHIVRVDEAATNKLVAAAEITRTVEYSSKTSNEVYDRASKFASESNTLDDFSNNAEKLGFIKRISPDLKEGEVTLPSIQNAREVIRWAFNDETKLGDVSEVLLAGDMYIVAALVTVKQKGTARMEDIKDQLENDVRKELKAKMLIERMQKVDFKNKTIEQIALELGIIVNSNPQTLFNNPNISFIGNDLPLVGAIMGSEKAKMYGPMQTANGVYIYIVNGVQGEVPQDENMVKAEKQRLSTETGGDFVNRSFQSLRDASDIKDYRYKFF